MRTRRIAIIGVTAVLAVIGLDLPTAMAAGAQPAVRPRTTPEVVRSPRARDDNRGKVSFGDARPQAPSGPTRTDPPPPVEEPQEGFVPGRSVERVEERTEHRQRFQNPDGTVTDVFSLEPRFHREGNELREIRTDLVPDGSRLAKRRSNGSKGVAVTENWFATRLGNLAQGVAFEVGGHTLNMTPVGASSLPDPVTIGEFAVYPDVWPGVDLRYRVTPVGLKEELILKSPTAPSSFEFTLAGAQATGPVQPGPDDIPQEFEGSLGLSGPIGDEIMFAPPIVTGPDDGRVYDEAAPVLARSGAGVRLSVDETWLTSLAPDAFPLVLDPTIVDRAGTGWTSFRNTGGAPPAESYVGNSCVNPPTCSQTIWRSIAKFEHSALYSNHIQNADLTIASAPVGNPGSLDLWIGWASAASYDGAGTWVGNVASGVQLPAGASTAFVDVDVTNVFQLIADQDPGNAAMLGFTGTQWGGYYSLRRVGFSTLDVTYESDGHVRNPGPASGYRSHSRRPTLSATVGNAGGPPPVNVGFEVSCPGQTISSGWIAVSPGVPYSWTLPQDLPWNQECWWKASGRNSSYEDHIGWYSVMATSAPPPTPMLDRSLDGKVVTTSSLTLSAPAFTDPEGDTAFVEYSIATSADGVTGRVVRSSGLAPGTPFQPTATALPDGVYYASARSYDSTGAGSAWSKPVKFRTAQRLGVQPKLAYDSAGPFTVNLGSGNLVLAAGGPSYSTLGGDAAVSLSYNSQAVVARGVAATFYEDRDADGSVTAGTDVKLTERIDPVVSYDWTTTGGPVPGVVNPRSFVGSWSGSYRNTTGAAQNVSFQASPIGAGGTGNKVRISVNGAPAVTAWDTSTAAVSIPPNSTARIDVQYGQVASATTSGFRVRFSEGSGWADVPADRWVQNAPVLPGGWSSTGPSLGTAGYARLSAAENQVTLYDDSGAAHVWVSTGDGFAPPPDEDGVLRRTASGFELTDDDGYLYGFNAEGNLATVVSPSDAVNPGALTYSYAALAGGGPIRLSRITDPFGRAVDLVYSPSSGTNPCPTATGSSPPPAFMLCQVRYSGFTRNSTGSAPTTDLIYDASGNLARLVNPGDVAAGVIRPTTDFVYDGAGRIVGVRDAGTNDLVAAGAFTSGADPATDPHWWKVSYGSGATADYVTRVTAPEAAAGAARSEHAYAYGLASTYARGSVTARSATRVAVTGSVNASGWTQEVHLDGADRPIQVKDQAGIAVETEWDPDMTKERVIRTIDHHHQADPVGGLVSTTVFDAADQPIETYGPGSAAELGSALTSLSAPKSVTNYDEGINGLAAKWFDVPDAAGAPKLYTTSSGNENWAAGSPTGAAFPGVTLPSDRFSGVLTGQASFATPTALGVRADGARLSVDDIKVGDTFGGAFRSSVRIDQPTGYWRLGETAGATAYDSVSNLNGTYVGGPTLNQAGALNQGGSADPDPAVAVAGTGAPGDAPRGVNVPKPVGAPTDPLDLTGDMAVEAWVYPTSAAGYQMIVARTAADNSASTYELRTESGKLQWVQWKAGVVTSATAANPLPLNTWSHVVGSRVSTRVGPTTTTTTIKLHVNGAEVATSTSTPTTVSLPTATTRIGHRTDGYGFAGRLDEVAVYAHGLSAARAADHLAAATSANPPELSTAKAWQQVVREDGPSGWWRLGDGAGSPTAADSSSDGAGAGTYAATTLGSAGAISGDADTAATFNGTSGGLTLAADSIPSRTVSVELWFKGTGRGALMAQHNDALTRYAPFLYVGTDNKLHGGFWLPTSGAPNMTSPNAVTDGQWHHVVLSSTGVSQTLYLDGVQIGEFSGVPDVSDMATTVVGSGYTTGWPSAPGGWAVYNGTIDEVAVYPYALSGARAATHFKTREIGEFSGTRRVRIDYQDLAGSASLKVVQGRPGSSVDVAAGVLKPRYGLVTSTVDPDGKRTSFEYQHPELGLQTAEVKDAAGLNLRTESTYEGASVANKQYRRPLTRKLPTLVGTATSPVRYDYYGQGTTSNTKDNPCTTGTTEVINQGGSKWKTTNVDPDGAGTATPIVEETVYFGDGLTAATRRGTEAWTCSTYDGRGRPLTVAYPAFGGSAARTVTHTYATSVDANKRLSVTVADNSTGDGFDNPTVRTTTDWLGRTVSYTDAAGVVTTTAYDVAGRVTQVTVNKGYGTLEYAYDSATGRQTTMKLDGKVLASSQYDAASGALTGVSYPSGTTNAGNGSSGSFGTDVRGRPTSVTWTGASAALLTSNSVTRSAGSRINHVWVDGADQSVGQDSFTYDGAGRLTAYRLGTATGTYSFGSQAGTCSSGALNSGKSSNRVSRTVGATTYAYCYDWADRLTSTTEPGYTGTIAYDGHGNMTTVAGETHSYDMADRHVRTVKGTTTVSYRRDATDRIVQRVQGTSTVRYGFTGDGDSPDLTLDGSGNLVERTVSLPGGALLTTRAGGNVWSYPNLTGDVAAVANQSGVKQGATTTYDPFGNVTAGSVPDNSAGNMDYGWKGQHLRPLERASGLVGIIEMGARQYSPVLGRFIEVDPVEGGSANDYDYTYADPINMTDLDGMWPSCGWCRKAWNKTKKAVKRAGRWAWRYKGEIGKWALRGVMVAGAVACTIASGGACLALTVAAFAGSAYKNAWDTGVLGKKKANWGRFAALTAVDAAISWTGNLPARSIYRGRGAMTIGRTGQMVLRGHGQAWSATYGVFS